MIKVIIKAINGNHYRYHYHSYYNLIGEFIVILDLFGFSWNMAPTLIIIHKILNLLKSHYPYRFSTLFIINSSTLFYYIYNQIKIFIPIKALKKIMILNSDDYNMMKNILINHIGKVVTMIMMTMMIIMI